MWTTYFGNLLYSKNNQQKRNKPWKPWRKLSKNGWVENYFIFNC